MERPKSPLKDPEGLGDPRPRVRPVRTWDSVHLDIYAGRARPTGSFLYYGSNDYNTAFLTMKHPLTAYDTNLAFRPDSFLTGIQNSATVLSVIAFRPVSSKLSPSQACGKKVGVKATEPYSKDALIGQIVGRVVAPGTHGDGYSMVFLDMRQCQDYIHMGIYTSRHWWSASRGRRARGWGR